MQNRRLHLAAALILLFLSLNPPGNAASMLTSHEHSRRKSEAPELSPLASFLEGLTDQLVHLANINEVSTRREKIAFVLTLLPFCSLLHEALNVVYLDDELDLGDRLIIEEATRSLAGDNPCLATLHQTFNPTSKNEFIASLLVMRDAVEHDPFGALSLEAEQKLAHRIRQATLNFFLGNAGEILEASYFAAFNSLPANARCYPLESRDDWDDFRERLTQNLSPQLLTYIKVWLTVMENQWVSPTPKKDPSVLDAIQNYASSLGCSIL